MLRTCKYCGRIHDATLECKARAEVVQKRKEHYDKLRKEKGTEADKFRSTRKWRLIRDEIKHRDRYLCLCCLAELEGTEVKYNTNDLSVHHIVPINKDPSLRAEGSNLITVCSLHHEMCECGLISKSKQRELVSKSIQGLL